MVAPSVQCQSLNIRKRVTIVPYAFPRPCRRCGETCPHHKSGLCLECQAIVPQNRDRDRESSRDRGYDAKWEKLRKQALIRDHFTCLDCGWQPNLVEMALEAGAKIPVAEVFEELRRRYRAKGTHLIVDHKIPIRRNKALRLKLENLQTLCSDCHAKKTAKESR